MPRWLAPLTRHFHRKNSLSNEAQVACFAKAVQNNEATIPRVKDWVSDILSLLSSGKWVEVAYAIHRDSKQYSQAIKYIVYADQLVDRFAAHYEQLGDWKYSRSTYEETLLTARDKNNAPFEGTSLALFHFAQMKRFLGDNAGAIPLLVELKRLEQQHETFPYHPENYFGLLIECYKDTGDVDAAQIIKTQLQD